MRDGGIHSPFPRLAKVTVALPACGFVSSLLYSLIYDFENTANTHCDVDEFAPSLSAVIGDNIPQKYVWNICIALHAAPRFLFAHMYRQYFLDRLTTGRWTQTLVQLNYWTNITETLCLIGLSYVGSNELFEAHAFFFTLFVITYVVSITLVTCYFLPFCGYQTKSPVDRDCYKIKTRLLISTYISGSFAVYFYWRHNEYCEPYVYSFFGLSEYTLILSNMAYHGLAAKDFSDWTINVGPDMILSR